MPAARLGCLQGASLSLESLPSFLSHFPSLKGARDPRAHGVAGTASWEGAITPARGGFDPALRAAFGDAFRLCSAEGTSLPGNEKDGR